METESQIPYEFIHHRFLYMMAVFSKTVRYTSSIKFSKIISPIVLKMSYTCSQNESHNTGLRD